MDAGAGTSSGGMGLSPAEDELLPAERQMVTSIRMGGYDSAGVGYGYLCTAERVLTVRFALRELRAPGAPLPGPRVSLATRRGGAASDAWDSTPLHTHRYRHQRVKLYRALAWAGTGAYHRWVDASWLNNDRRRQRSAERSRAEDLKRACPETESELRRLKALKPKALRRACKEESDNLILSLLSLVSFYTLLRGAERWDRIGQLTVALLAGSGEPDSLRRRYCRISSTMKERERSLRSDR